MRYIGPIVRNDLFFFVTMLALAALMVLFEYRSRSLRIGKSYPPQLQRPSGASWSGPPRREKMWMTAVVSVSFVFIFLSTAEFIYAKSSTALSAPNPSH